jgi:hypothetical protein
MAIRIEKPWTPLTAEAAKKLPGQLGVYQLADASGAIVYIGYAGGRSLFGVRSAIQDAVEKKPGGATQFRVEINQQYMTRWQELLMLHQADHGGLPAAQGDDKPMKLGRLSPL